MRRKTTRRSTARRSTERRSTERAEMMPLLRTRPISGASQIARDQQRTELGDGTLHNAAKPVQVVSLSNVERTVTALRAEDRPDQWCWGSNSFGQLGIGSSGQNLLPTRVLDPCP